MKLYLVLIFGFPFLTFAQTDSTDLNFYYTEPELNSISDSVMFPPDLYSELHLEFDLTDSVNTTILYVELRPLGLNDIIFHHAFTKSFLINNGLLNNSTVTLSLGNWMNSKYQIAIRIEDVNKNHGPTLKRSLII